MKVIRLLIVLVCLVGVVAVAVVADDEKDKEKERTEIRQMSQETLTRLYKVQPAAKAAVEKAFGYAVFSKDRKSTRLNSSHSGESRMPSSA